MKKDSDLPRHRAYLLRFWETRSLPSDSGSQWRYSLENLHGSGEHKFSGLDALTAFLEKETGQGAATVSAAAESEAESGEKVGCGAISFDSSGLSILLVEEDRAIRESVSRWLKETMPDAVVIGAEDDQTAEALARAESPDVVLIDVAPPKEDSGQAISRLRAAAPEAEIVALTMDEPKPRRALVMEAGANACVRIWEMRRQLLHVLNELLSGREGEPSQRTVVCIEDEIDMLSLIKFTLERHNIELVSALGGKEGLQTVLQTEPDLVLLDLMMPDVDGLEVYHSLRNHEETRDIPVIVLTVLDPHWVESRGMDLSGIADYVTKPFVPQDLVKRVSRALEVVA